jgi:hypothetical protein
MATYAPRVPLLLHKRSGRVKGIAALRAEEMTNVPFGATCNDDLTLNGRFAALTPRGEGFVKVEVAEEAERFVAVCIF